MSGMAMAGYTPLFNSIVTSSIWNEDSETRIVWITLLALADADGKVEGSVAGLAPVARIPIESCQKALGKLMAPDEYSRTKENEGRRIQEIDGGWLILNHRKFREKAKSRAEYYKKWRQQTKTQTNTQTQTVKHPATGRNRKNVAQQKRFVPPTLEEVEAYIAENPELSNVDAQTFWKGFNDSGWIDTQGKPVRNWKLKIRTWSKFGENRDQGGKKIRLFPIAGKICSLKGCKLPAVYKDSTGSYDHYYCSQHMPENVKELYE